MEKLSSREIEFITTAAQFLEKPSFLIHAASAVGKPLELLQRTLPKSVQNTVNRAAQKALSRTLDVSIATLPRKLEADFPFQPLRQGKMHSAAAAVTGAVGGFFGPASLLVELPLTTGIMFRSIATIAQSFGEDLSDPQVRFECLQIFAMGSPHTSQDDAMKSAYLSQRMAFHSFLRKASEKGAASLMARVLTRVASEFEVVVAEKLLAEALPILGAAGGAAINVAFTNYFNRTGYYHFGLRHLERKYGFETVQKTYLEVLP